MENEQKSFNKRHIITSVVGFFFVIMLTIVLTTGFTMATFGLNSSDGDELSLGSIALDDIAQNFSVKDASGNTLSLVAPGDDAKVNFTLQNAGTADVFVRFQLILNHETVDTSVFTITIESAKYTKTVEGTPQEFNAEYALYDFTANSLVPSNEYTGEPNTWFVRRVGLIGNLDTLTNDPPDEVTLNIHFNGDEMDDTYKNAQIGLNLYVQTVQVANNPTLNPQKDVTLPGYNVIWSE